MQKEEERETAVIECWQGMRDARQISLTRNMQSMRMQHVLEEA